MSSRKRDKEQLVNDSLDGLIRWALHDSVAGAEPSSQVWERIEGRVVEELGDVIVQLFSILLFLSFIKQFRVNTVGSHELEVRRVLKSDFSNGFLFHCDERNLIKIG